MAYTSVETAKKFFDNKQYQQSIEQCLIGLRQDKENIQLIYILAKSYYNNKDFSQCEVKLKEIIKIKPDEFDANFFLGILLTQKKKYEEALDILTRLKKKYPSKWKIHMYMTENYLGIKDYQNAFIEANLAYKWKHSIFNIYNIIRVVIWRHKTVSLILLFISGVLAFFIPQEVSLLFLALFLVYPFISALAYLGEKHFINGFIVLFYIIVISYLYIIFH